MSYIENFHHIIFRTKGSRKTIPEAEKRTMLAYMYKVSQEMGVTVLRLNAYLNHMHIFANLPSDMAVSEYVQKIKSTSSKVFNHHPQFRISMAGRDGSVPFQSPRRTRTKSSTTSEDRKNITATRPSARSWRSCSAWSSSTTATIVVTGWMRRKLRMDKED